MPPEQLWQLNQSVRGIAAGKTVMLGKHRTNRNRAFGDRPPSNETVICSERIQIERKSFQFTLKENPRGKFLRITEDVGGRRDSIIVPATGLDDFCKVLSEVAKGADEPPHATPEPSESPEA